MRRAGSRACVLALAARAVRRRRRARRPGRCRRASSPTRSATTARPGLLVASGNVEVLYQGRVLRAARITYDEAADEIRAEGPLVLTDPDGGVLLADAAALTPDLTEGLISSARLLIAGQAAARRGRGRGAAATATPRSTGRSPAPARSAPRTRPRPGRSAPRASPTTPWSAGIYFENARVEVFGLPVGYVPRLSASPSPGSSARAACWCPSFSQSDIYGFGFKLPYYRVLGPSADATVTPFVTTSGGVAARGRVPAPLRRRRLRPLGRRRPRRQPRRPTRAAARIFGDGALPASRDGFVADFDLDVASDDSFLQQYDYSDADRLTSFVRVSRTRADEYVELGAVGFQSLRDDEDTATVPFVFPVLTYRRLIEAPATGGRARHRRRTRSASCATTAPTWCAPAAASTGSGSGCCRGACSPRRPARAVLDVYQVWNDPVQPDGDLRRAACRPPPAELRWPLVRATAPRRARHRADRPGDLVRVPRRDRRAERGQPAARVRRDQPLLAQPLPRRGPAGDRPARQPRRQLHPLRPGRLVARRDARPGDPRRAAATSSPTAPASPAAGRTTSARSTLDFGTGARRWSTGRCSTPSSTSGATSSRSPTTATRAGLQRRLRLSRRGRRQPLPRAAARDERARRSTPATGSTRTGRCAASGATTSSDGSNLRAGAGDHLRQRVRRVRPFGLAPLHLIG